MRACLRECEVGRGLSGEKIGKLSGIASLSLFLSKRFDQRLPLILGNIDQPVGLGHVVRGGIDLRAECLKSLAASLT